jgi:hypothetical protein
MNPRRTDDPRDGADPGTADAADAPETGIVEGDPDGRPVQCDDPARAAPCPFRADPLSIIIVDRVRRGSE